ncbi:hypothetical protein ACET3Z_031788 [Daucus carota]
MTSSWKPSKSSECSVSSRETRLSNKWMEYQGIKNWDGLLDPLDDDLRSEILRYGGFVEAAYRSFEFDNSAGKYGTCRYGRDSLLPQCGLGGIGYKVTKNLRATSGIQLPGWIDKSPRSSWIGYVAVCNDKDEISRLGRRDVVIALRGTVTCLEWMENLRVTLTSMDEGGPTRAMVERGFLSLYTSHTATCPSLRDSIREEVSRIIQTYGDEALSITITGHSLGAALATLTAYDISSTFRHLLTTVISFGGPRVGNKTFSDNLEQNGTRILRIVNSNDVITKVPGFVIEEDHHNIKKSDQKVTTARAAARWVPTWLQKHVENTQWLYADVGKELRLCCNNSNKVTCHDLSTYLDLVKGFVSSTCPLRATAKKVLCRRAQHDQHQLLVR